MEMIYIRKRLEVTSEVSLSEIFENVQIYSLRGFPIFNKMNIALEEIQDRLNSLESGLYILKCLGHNKNLHTYRVLVNESEELIKIA